MGIGSFFKKALPAVMTGGLSLLADGSMTSGGTETATNTSSTQIPAYMQRFINEEGGVLDAARNAVATPYSSYVGNRVAGLTPDQLNAFDLARSNVGSTIPYQNAASGFYDQAGSTLGGYLPQAYDYATQAGGAYDPFMQMQQDAMQTGLDTYNPLMQESTDLARGAFANYDPRMAGAGDYITNAYNALPGNLQTGLDYSTSGLAQFSPFAAEGASAMRQGQGLSADAADMFTSAGGAITPDMIASYMNPYQDQVIDSTMTELNRQDDIARTGRDSRAVAAGAFGGDRRHIIEAEAGRNLTDIKAKTIAGLNASNYGNAQQMAQAEMQRRMGAGSGIAGVGGQLVNTGGALANVGSNILNANRSVGNDFTNYANTMFGAGTGTGSTMADLYGQRFNAATGTAGNLSNLGTGAFNVMNTVGNTYGGMGTTLSDIYSRTGDQLFSQALGGAGAYSTLGADHLGLGSYAQGANEADYSTLSGIGSALQTQDQLGLDVAYQDWLSKQAAPFDRANFLSGIASGTPTGTSTTSTTQTPTPSPLSQILGLGATGLGAYLGMG